MRRHPTPSTAGAWPPLHVTVPRDRTTRLPDWALVKFTAWEHDDDRHARPDGIVVASPLRTLFALAADFNQFRFERAAEDAWHLGLVTPDDAAQYLAAHRCRGKDGVARMEQWLSHATTQRRPAQSALEHDVLRALDEIGLPTPVRQHPLVLLSGERIHIDIAWPGIRLGIEPGSSWWHGGDSRQRNDQLRDLACGEIGWQIVRIDERVRSDLPGFAARIAHVYRQRTRDLGPSPSLAFAPERWR